jgi:hypothetical protein
LANVSRSSRCSSDLATIYPTFAATAGRLPSSAAEEISQRLIGLAAHPTLSRALLGLEPLVSDLPDRERLADDVDLDAIGRVARALLTSG